MILKASFRVSYSKKSLFDTISYYSWDKNYSNCSGYLPEIHFFSISVLFFTGQSPEAFSVRSISNFHHTGKRTRALTYHNMLSKDLMSQMFAPKTFGFFLTSQIILQDLVKRSSAFAHPRRTLKYYSTLVWLSEILPFMRPHLWCSSSPLISDAILHVLSLQMIFMCPRKDVFFSCAVISGVFVGVFFHVSSANLS